MQLNSTAQKTGRILFAAFATSTLIGQSFMDLFSILFSFWMLWYLYNKKANAPKMQLPKIGLESFWLVWILVISLGFITNFDSANPQLTIKIFLSKLLEFKWILVLYFTFEGFNLFFDPKRDLKKYALWILAPIAYSAGCLIFKWDPLLGKESLRAGGLFSNAMTFAHALSIPFCLLFGVLAVFTMHQPSKDTFKNNRVLWCIMFLAGLTLLATMTRGVWLGIAIAIIFAGFLIRPKIGALTIVGLAILAGILFATVKPIRERILFTQTFETSYDRQRIWLWEANWQIFKDHPLLGAGYGENKTQLPKYYAELNIPQEQAMFAHAHNQYLHFLAGTGALGLFCYLYLMGFFLGLSRKAYRAWRDSDPLKSGLSLGSFTALIAFLIGGLTEANFEHSKIKYMLVLLWALILWLQPSRTARHL